nr:unnamed protein product [Callosobruchus analis]
MSSSSKAPVQSQVRDEDNTNISSNRNENFTQAKNIAGAKSVYNEVLASPTIHHQQQQLKLTSYLPKKIEKSTNHNINNALLELFISDYQSFRIVEDKGFKKFVHALNPNYDLPNRKKISSTLIPAKYEECLNDCRKLLAGAKKICLTTDCWTSVNMDSFIAVTSHFINDEYELKSILLECSVLMGHHTSQNLATTFKE